MKPVQKLGSESAGWSGGPPNVAPEAQLVLLFGGTKQLAEARWMADLKRAFPNAHLFGCSTAGEIAGTRVYDDTVVATAVHFEHSTLRLAQVRMSDASSSEDAGKRLARAFEHTGLRHVFVLSDGQSVNGSELVRGLLEHMPEGVQVTGGLAGDGARFEKTYILAGETPIAGSIGAIGLYGERLQIGYGSLGGWGPVGPLRILPRSGGHLLVQVGRQTSIRLYKSYLC